MLFEQITILDETLQEQKNQYVGIRNERIDYIGPEKPKEDYGDSYSGHGKLLTSAFYNAHSHSAMTLLRGYGEGLALSDWLNTRIFPFEAKLAGEDIYWGALLAFAEMLRFGIVSTTDMYFFGEEFARAALESGVKANLSLGVTCFDGSDFEHTPFFPQYERLRRQSERWGSRLKLDLCVHGEYTSNPEVVRGVAQYAKAYGLRTHIHLSETREEQEACKNRHGGRTPAEYFNGLGLFDAPTTAAHCVWLEGDDFEILKEKGVFVASCPTSNLKLASGFCPVSRLLEEGIPVALGTDGTASNNNLNLLEDLKLFALLAKGASQNPTVVTPRQAIACATRVGALSQGREDCGCLKVGSKADLVVWNLDVPWMRPTHDLCSNLLYAANGADILLTMADGKILYQDGVYPTLDIERIVFEAERSAASILKQLEENH